MTARILRGFVILLGVVLLGYVASPVEAQACFQSNYIVGAEGNTNSYGVRGKLLTNDPDTTCGWYVAVFVLNQNLNNNFVEAGWYESPGRWPGDPNGKHPYTFWSKDQFTYAWYEMTWISITPGTTHQYKFTSQPAQDGCNWEFRFDGSLSRVWFHQWCAGLTAAQQERWNLNDGDRGGVPKGRSYLSDLRKFDSTRTGSLWTVINPYDYDAEYKFCGIFVYEFRVKPAQETC